MLSRNKVAVPEGAAGTPPFWRGVGLRLILRVFTCFWLFISFIFYLGREFQIGDKKLPKTSQVGLTTEAETGNRIKIAKTILCTDTDTVP